MSSLYMKLIGGALAAVVVLGLFLGLRHYKSLAESRGQTLAAICQATRDASGQGRLKCGDVPKQIQFMGEAIGTLTTALHKQSTKVEAMGAETTRQQKEAEQASQVARGRARAAQATSDRLTASSRAGGPSCEPSKALKGAWK